MFLRAHLSSICGAYPIGLTRILESEKQSLLELSSHGVWVRAVLVLVGI